MKQLAAITIVTGAIATTAWQAQAGPDTPTAGRRNLPPVCCFDDQCQQQSGFTKLLGCDGAETTFELDASNSFDPEGQPLTFEWTSGPGSTIDDVSSPVTLLRIDTSTDCNRSIPIRVEVNDGTASAYCRLFVEVIDNEVICGDRPAQIVCIYTGEDCGASNHSQDPAMVQCSGTPAFASPVHILVTQDSQPKRIYFEGVVEVGGIFTIDGEGQPGGKVPPTTHIEVSDLEGNELQDIVFHTSCSQPLEVGDQYGSVFLIDFTP